jgi:hypothetical protein
MLRSIEVKSHWQTVVENFNTSTLDFYKTVEEAIAKRQQKWPRFSEQLR